MNSLRIVIAFLALVASAPVFCADNLDPMPPFDYSELKNEAVDGWGFKSDEVLELRMLAWNREQDTRGQRVDNVLFWLRLKFHYPKGWGLSQPDAWALISMSKRIGRDKEWQENARIGPHGRPGILLLGRPPSNEDIYRFLGTGWTFTSTNHFRLLDGTIRQNTWREVVGEHATKFHQNEIAAPL